MKSLFFNLFLLFTLLFTGSVNTIAQADYPPPWVKYNANPLNLHGNPGTWNQSVITPCVIYNSDLNRYEMWFTAFTGAVPNPGIGYAHSSDGIIWSTPVLVMTPGPANWDLLLVGAVSVIKEGSLYKMWYTGRSASLLQQIGYATSPDGINWTKDNAHNPVLSPGTGWEAGSVGMPSVIKVSDGYWMFYSGEVPGQVSRTGRAFSTDGIHWQKDTVHNPVLLPGGPGQWDQDNFLAKVMVMNDSLYMCYTGQSVPGNNSTTAIGFAKSADMGITWVKRTGNPIITRGTMGSSWDFGRIETGAIIYKSQEIRIYYDGSGEATGNQGRVGLAVSTPFIPVPVELISFTATTNNDEVILNWSTATETNNHGFEIERQVVNGQSAADIKNWITIGFVNGSGTIAETKSYTFTDSKVSDGKYKYRLKQTDFDGSYEYSPEVEAEVFASLQFSLEQNYPNPFNPVTTIEYSVKERTAVRLSVLNLLGEEIAVIVNDIMEAGYHQTNFNASGLASGTYLIKLNAGGKMLVRKMILLK